MTYKNIEYPNIVHYISLNTFLQIMIQGREFNIGHYIFIFLIWAITHFCSLITKFSSLGFQRLPLFLKKLVWPRKYIVHTNIVKIFSQWVEKKSKKKFDVYHNVIALWSNMQTILSWQINLCTRKNISSRIMKCKIVS